MLIDHGPRTQAFKVDLPEDFVIVTFGIDAQDIDRVMACFCSKELKVTQCTISSTT